MGWSTSGRPPYEAAAPAPSTRGLAGDGRPVRPALGGERLDLQVAEVLVDVLPARRVRRCPRLRLLVADTLGPEALADPAGRVPVADDGREAVAPAADGDLGHDTVQIRSLAPAPYPPTHN